MEGEDHKVVMIRKGPWMVEEDEILMDYVKKYGPRDWSSIRSKGLLPRTGKSCRLRWVNKLKPNLKTGCKFSLEEERIVIDLQAQFGNKWAKIATYLPGRTDNDVKNFWSTRRKRLARILHTSTPTLKPQKNHGKSPVFCDSLEAPTLNSVSEEASSSSMKYSCQSSSYMDNSELIKMVAIPDLVKQKMPNLEPILPESTEFPQTDENKPTMDLPQPLQFPFQELLPEPPVLDLPVMLENQDIDSDVFGNGMISGTENDSRFSVELPFFELGNNSRINIEEYKNPATPDSFFDDFPTDMFEYIESLPSSSEH